MNPKRRFFLTFFILSSLVIFLLTTCKKDPYQVGIDLLPPGDTLNVKSTDTCTVNAYSVRVDTIHTSNCNALTLGSFLDPTFGITTISPYFQILPSGTSVDFGTNPVVDSLMLLLYYSGYYGDTLTQQRIRVYEVAEDIHIDSGYFSNKTMQVYPNLLADQTFKPKPRDSVKVGKNMYSAHLRINLSKINGYLANKLLNSPASVYNSSAQFTSFMKGLYIETSPVTSDGALLNFDIAEGITKMIVYFHNSSDDSLSYSYLINQSSARFLHIDHDNYYLASQGLKQQVINGDTLLGREILYLEGMAGTRIRFRMPYITGFEKSHKIAINDALLLFENPSTDTTLSPPPQLVLLRDSSGYYGSITDQTEGGSYFGGGYNKETRTYFFRMTRYIQKLVSGSFTLNRDLYIMVNNPSSNIVYPNRVTITGYKPSDPSAVSSRFRLLITYTVLN